jgi:hypothetical protein
MADALTSGLSGLTLTKVLQAHFPAISRGEVFAACALAASIWHADQTLLELEVTVLRRRLAELEAGA